MGGGTSRLTVANLGRSFRTGKKDQLPYSLRVLLITTKRERLESSCLSVMDLGSNMENHRLDYREAL